MDEEAIFNAAIEQPSLAERARFLDEACAGDVGLRPRVEALLAAFDQPESFLNAPAAGVDRTIDQPPAEQPGQTIGRYKLLEEIGEGGMGVVYMAEQREPVRRKVALKIIKPGMDTREVIARFEAERQALALMDHPNIARVLDGGTTESGRPYFVMDLVQGIPITEYCDQANLTTRQRLALFVLVCQAVQHAHQKGIIHRDVKPSNVLVALHDGVPVPKIIDFGIAKAINQQLTEKSLFTGHGRMIGTPLYMSPEQAEMSGLDVDTRSDIYSLGVLLYELLTGNTPFDRERLREAGFDEVRRIIREVDPPRPSTRVNTLQAADLSTISDRRQVEPRKLSHQLRGDLDWIVMKALDKDRTRRYESASAFAADVERFLADEPVRAKRAGPMIRLRKWTKRHKAVTAVAATVLLAAAISGTATAVQAYQRDVRLTAMATEGLADVRVAMAEKEFGRAQRRATEIQAELAAAPKVKAQFSPELEDLLHQAEVGLRLQRFEKLAEEARFSANRVLWQWWAPDPAEARRCCRQALAVFHVLDNDRWLQELEWLPLERTELTRIKQSLAEVLFLLALVENGSGDGVNGTRRAITLLDHVEVLVPNLRVLYEYRGRYRTILGEHEAARSDSQRAGTMHRSTWLDHYFAAFELCRQEKLRDALPEIEAALTFKIDDYWSWRNWSHLQSALGAPDRARWALSVCIRLRPEEPSAWIARGHAPQSPSGAIADLSRALELSNDPVLRAMTYFQLANLRLGLGQPEVALGDLNTVIRLAPNNAGAFLGRARCYRALGQREKARADARRYVELSGRPTDAYAYGFGLTAFTILGEQQQAVDLAVALYKNEGLRDWVPMLEANVEGDKIPQKAFVLAMARWKLGDKDHARGWYEKGVGWMDKTQNPDPLHFLEETDLPRLRDETAALLGLPVKPPAAKEKTEATPKAESAKRK